MYDMFWIDETGIMDDASFLLTNVLPYILKADIAISSTPRVPFGDHWISAYMSNGLHTQEEDVLIRR